MGAPELEVGRRQGAGWRERFVYRVGQGVEWPTHGEGEPVG